MIHVVYGGSGSGKSAYAEQLLTEMSDVENKVYLAAMQVWDDEDRARVERHRALRAGKGFTTVECPRNVTECLTKMKAAGMNPQNCAVLLECLSNLTANEMFGEVITPADEVFEKVKGELTKLSESVKHLIVVTNNVFEDGVIYDEGTQSYIELLGRLNDWLVACAETATEVVVGIPVLLKGSVGKVHSWESKETCMRSPRMGKDG